MSSYNVMPIITIVILVNSHQGKARQDMMKYTQNKETGEKRKRKLIHTDKQTDGRTDGWTERRKSFIDMR